MSLSADVPTNEGLSVSPHISAAPKCSTIFGHELLAVHRSRIPFAGNPRTVSGQSFHHCGPSAPASYSFPAPSGSANRVLRVTLLPAMIGHAPSYTLRLFSSWVKP